MSWEARVQDVHALLQSSAMTVKKEVMAGA